LIKTYAQKHPLLSRAAGCAAALSVIGLAVGAATLMLPGQAEAPAPLAVVTTTTCADPIAGVWTGYQHLRNAKYRFDATIERGDVGGESLRGTILSHYWVGDATSTAPPSCASPMEQHVVSMPAEGTFANGELRFGGTAFTELEGCGQVEDAYYPDRFSGHLTEDGLELHAINDDGHNPETFVVFRRTACAP